MEMIKLTVRLPLPLHRALQERARRQRQSLNQTIVDELFRAIGATADSEATFLRRVLREEGLLAEPGLWDTGLWEGPAPTAEEVRQLLAGAPPLSDIVIAERGEA
jgi:hypothetical protein